jgi:GT2 family glycosyltransferase
MTEPIVSVLMTVYNGQKYVEESLRSVLNQDMADLELVVVDDGSTDQTPHILERLAAEDARLRFVSQENKGSPRASNDGIALCRGRYIARNDSDDLSKPQRLRRQLDYIEQTAAICVGSYADMIDAEGRYLTTLKTPEDNATIQDLALRGHGSIFHSSSFIRRDVLVQIGGYDVGFKYALDLDLWLRLGEVGELRNIPEALIQYRLHDTSVSQTQGQLQRDFARKACERAYRRRGVEPCFEASEVWREGKDRQSRVFYAARYGWWAFNSGQRKTALIYGCKAVLASPLKLRGWRLLICAAIKPMPKGHRDES